MVTSHRLIDTVGITIKNILRGSQRNVVELPVDEPVHRGIVNDLCTIISKQFDMLMSAHRSKNPDDLDVQLAIVRAEVILASIRTIPFDRHGYIDNTYVDTVSHQFSRVMIEAVSRLSMKQSDELHYVLGEKLYEYCNTLIRNQILSEQDRDQWFRVVEP